MARQRRLVHYSGRVQGVGFRYTAKRIAAGYTVDGYVRNLADGRVELVVEGQATELDSMLDELAQEMSGHIRHVQCEVTVPSGQFEGFQIRH